MAPRTLDTEIDRLYQLPLDEFTAARNALAKDAGPDAARIRALSKPPVAAWAVNQLHWRDRDAWDALVEASESARRAHRAVLAGRGGDVRAAGKVHDDAVEAALKATLGLVADAGHPVTDATKQAILTTLRALPGDEPPGRLTRTLQPGGFEALAGLSLARGAQPRPSKPAPAPPPKRSAAAEASPSSRPKVDVKALTRARQDAAAATRALRDAESAARRAEFETVRTKREEERAQVAIEKAREAVKRAAADLEQAEAAASLATRNREAAAKRARETEKALGTARADAESADADVKKIERG